MVGVWWGYIFGEIGYIVLSLASKTLLGWLVFGGGTFSERLVISCCRWPARPYSDGWCLVGVHFRRDWLYRVVVGQQDLTRMVGVWWGYIFGEIGYIVLSLASKTLLGWLVFG